MLKLYPQRASNCEQASRRQFMLEVGSLAGLGLSLDVLLRAKAAQASTGPARASETNCILIWTRGGTSHHDTLDPKPEAPPEVRGDFGVIDTALTGIKFSDQMPNFAKQLGRYSLMRNLNPQNGSHATADAIMMSGKRFNPAITYPCFGSVVAKEKGNRNNLPPFVQIGNNVDRRFGGGLGGYLGIAYNAFELPGDPSDKNFTVRDVTPPSGISLARIDRRREALKTIDRLQRDLEVQPDALKAMDEYYENAFNMITAPSTQKAFDLGLEDPRIREFYGEHNLGQSCLLARRLIEAGTRFVTVTSGGWDTHQNNFTGLKKLLPPLDQAFPALLEDLEQRGLLETTLVVWMTDFGRTPVVNSAAGRDHWSTASVLCMAGAGTPAGTALGKTDDTGAKPVDHEYYPQDVAATVYAKLGIPLDTTHHAPDGRPMRLCEGRVIPELMS
ncbi:MAG TPA: DUF1501 domain-containing protein [Pirellulales bacterium]|nr:DUF1501 domain-containing protein [Pirellulales bacterium]